MLATLVGISALLAGPVTAQVTPVGGTARNFTVTNRANNQPINLTGFAGKILVIDFFAYWCGPCQDASPDVETNIQKYYASRGGNAYGVPVVVLAASIDASSPSQTDAFVANAGLELAAEDNGGSSGAWSQFNSAGSIPLFVIINCAASSPNTAQWKVLYKQAGYAGAPALRSVIDAVQAPSPEILSFDFPGMGMPTARIAGTNITVTAPAGTDLTTLIPSYTVSSGATGSPASGTARNFSTPQTYTVTLGTATKTYTVTVTPFGRYDFNDGTLQGWNNRVWNGSAWIDLAPNATTYSGTLLPASTNNGLFVPGNGAVWVSGNTDNHLNTLWLRSPQFYLNGSGDLTVDLAQGIANTTAPANDLAVPYASITTGGWKGVALRRASDGVFVLAKPRTGGSGGTYRTVTFTRAELAPFVGSAVYTLDLINSDQGSWGWLTMDNVSIPGSAVGQESSPRWNVSIDTATRTGLAGPAGGTGETWNQPLNVAGLTSTSLLDAGGTTTSVGFTCSAGYVSSWGSPSLTILTGGAFQWDWNASASLVLSNLIPARKYDLYLASFHPNEQGGSTVFSTTNTTTTVGTQNANNGGGNGNSSTWVQGTNYARFQNIVPSSGRSITVNMVGDSGTNAKRAYLSGFQLVDVTYAPTATTVALTAGSGSSYLGAPLTFTATVAGGAAPAGNVTFYDGVTPLGTTALNASKQASLTLGTLVIGSHYITARYLGNSSNAFSSTAPLSQTVLALSSAKDMLTFVFAGLPATTLSATTISVTAPYGTNVTALAPTYTLSPLATATPASASARNFTSPQSYTVTAQDGTTKTYVVTVTVAPSPYSVWASAGTQGLTAGVNDGLSQDPDNDGISNLLEFALGGAPMAASRANLPVLTKSAGTWAFEYDRSNVSLSSTTQVVEYGSGVTGWTAVTIPATTAGIVTITPGSQSAHVKVSLPNLGTKGFVRLKVTAN